MPELSFGSHMFQDLVEADIYYGAIFENEKRLEFNKNIFKHQDNILKQINSHLDEDIYDMIHVMEFKGGKVEFYHDMKKDETMCILK